MKLILLPLSLLLFTFACLAIVHIDNINKLEESAYERKVKIEKLKKASVTHDQSIASQVNY